MNTTRSTRKLISYSFLCLLFFAGCKEHIDTTQAIPNVYAEFFNASNFTELDVYLDGKQIGSQMLIGDLIGYLSAQEAVTHTLKFIAPGLSLEKPVSFNGDTNTIFFVNNQTDPTAIDLLNVIDIAQQPAATNMMIRFINLSSDSPALNITLGPDRVASNQTFKQITQFREQTAAAYTIEVRRADNNDLLLSGTNIQFAAGEYYTIAVIGQITPSSDRPQELQLQLINP